MNDTPDFEQIADRLVVSAAPFSPHRAAVVEQLRLIWNARGASDIAKVEAELSSMMGATKAGPYIKNLDRALRTLDRSS